MKLSAKPDLTRPPIASGRFYSAHAEKLEIEISQMVDKAKIIADFKVSSNDELIALIAPHAGYVYSGTVAASAFIHIEDIAPRKRVFLIGSSHHTDFNGASIYSIGNYQTPFGIVKVDLDLANRLIKNSEIINFVQPAHAHEHCLEVLLPFLQYFWKSSFEIVPIIIASHLKDTCKQLAEELQPYFNNENLFIISTDLSHYPRYSDAQKIDKKTVNAVLSGNPEELLKQIKANKQENIPNLSTSMCGWTSVLTLMYLAENVENLSYIPILYQNSGDAKVYSEADRVVGYQSIAITKLRNLEVFQLSEEEKQILINTALKSISNYSKNKSILKLESSGIPDKLLVPGGAFVSIYLKEELRGCIGRMHSKETPLIQIIAETAVSSAFFDNRFPELNSEELKQISVEISVLTPLKKIENIDEIVLGKHGIYIKKDFQTGTFLPQVADKTNWTVEEFLGNCSENKAGLGWDGWKDAEIFIYEAIVFKS